MNVFTLTSSEEKQIIKWKKEHQCELRNSNQGVKNEVYVGAIGGSTTYMFTPTGLGVITQVKCACGSMLDITDTGEW